MKVIMALDPSRIRSIRKQLGVTQTEFGQLLNVSRDTVINWEKGRSQPSELEEELIRGYRRKAQEQQGSQWVKQFMAMAAGGAFGALLGQLFSSDSTDE